MKTLLSPSLKQIDSLEKVKLFSHKDAVRLLPKRFSDHNKSHFGKGVIVAGSRSYPGAAILCATACARSGAGYTYLATQEKLFPIHRHPDFILINPKDILSRKKEFSSVAFGPGLDVSSYNEKLLRNLLEETSLPLVIDASGLEILSKLSSNSWGERVILTPHEGEMAMLLGESSTWIKNNRLKALERAHKKWDCTVLLKGADSLIRTRKKILKVNAGTPALAKSGTGDVLTGIITGLLSQGLLPSQAAPLGAYIHGWCSQLWEKEGHNSRSLLASDLLGLLGKFK